MDTDGEGHTITTNIHIREEFVGTQATMWEEPKGHPFKRMGMSYMWGCFFGLNFSLTKGVLLNI